MSDPVTNAEIEDVLSSIRRLVSEDPASLDRAHKRPSTVEKLVLTDALRVVEPAGDDDEALSDAEETAELPPLSLGDEDRLDAPETESEENAESAEDEALELRLAEVMKDSFDSGDVTDPEAAFWSDGEAAADTGETDDDTDALIASLREDGGETEVPEEVAEVEVPEPAHEEEKTAVAEDHPGFSEDAVAALYAEPEPEAEPEHAEEPQEEIAAEPEPEAEIPEKKRILTLEERIAELEAAINRTSGEWEPDGSETAEEVTQSSPVFDSHTGSEDEPESGAFDIDSLSSELWGGSEEDGEDAAEATPQAAPEPEEESTSDALTAFLNAPDEEPEEDHSEPEAEAHTEEPEEAAEDEDAAEEVEEPHAEEKPEPEHTEPEQVEPVEATADPEPQLAEAEDRQDDHAVAAPAEPSDHDAIAMDEDALRALVAEVIREELQGNVGERITRNVKRLVRREVQRALSMKSLD